MSWIVHNADCLDFLRTLPDGSVDAVVTDPPYAIKHRSNGQWFRTAKQCAGDDSLASMMAVCAWADSRDLPLACFYSSYAVPPVKWRNVLVWNKGPQVGIGGDRETCWKRDHELIGVKNNAPLNGNRDSSVLDFPAMVRKPSGHFCEKPIDLMVYLIEKLTQPGDTILDPFAGSGTTGVACVQTGRKFIGVEIDAGYCEIARRRIAEAVPLFAGATE